MSETHLSNDPAARTETGEIKNQAAVTETPNQQQTDQAKSDTAKVELKTEGKSEGKPSLLNDKEGEGKGPPEKYADFKLPEGYSFDDAVKTEANALFKDLGLSQDGAQKLIDFYTAKHKAALDAPIKAWQDQQEKWIGEVKADPEIGGKLGQVKTDIAKAINSLGPDLAAAFREVMDFTGAGNNPTFIKAFWNFSKRLTEGGHVAAGGPSKFGQSKPGAQPESAARAMYPNLN